MSKFYILVITGLIASTQLQAKEVNGSIYLGDDTLNVIFDIPVNLITQKLTYTTFERLQNRVKYFDSDGNKQTINPETALEIRFQYNEKEFRMLSRTKPVNKAKSKIFLRLQIDGNLKLFRYYYTQSSLVIPDGAGIMTYGGSSPKSSDYFFQKGDDVLKSFNGMLAKADMVEYFYDCPVLANKIESKEFEVKQMRDIASFYNNNCNSNFKEKEIKTKQTKKIIMYRSKMGEINEALDFTINTDTIINFISASYFEMSFPNPKNSVTICYNDNFTSCFTVQLTLEKTHYIECSYSKKDRAKQMSPIKSSKGEFRTIQLNKISPILK